MLLMERIDFKTGLPVRDWPENGRHPGGRRNCLIPIHRQVFSEWLQGEPPVCGRCCCCRGAHHSQTDCLQSAWLCIRTTGIRRPPQMHRLQAHSAADSLSNSSQASSVRPLQWRW